MKQFKLYSVFAVMLVLAFGATASAAPNIFGVSGGLELPHDTTLGPGQVSLGYHLILDAFDADTSNWFTGSVGILPGFEAGIGFVLASDDVIGGDDNAFLLNAKYRIVAETADRPAFTIGVVDLIEELSNDPGFFLVVSKTLTGYAEEVTGEPSKPLRGHIGFGSGIYEGFFVGLDWTLTPKVQVGFEYLAEGLEGNDINGYLRYALNRDLRFDVGAIDFSDFTVGLSYTSMRF